jgi:hypothetical protein
VTIVKAKTIVMAIAILVVMGFSSPLQAQMATADEALAVANNWISLITASRGTWGETETAEVEGLQEFKRGERVIGYFCPVKPQGYIVVSLRKELAPVKAYSERTGLNPESEEGLADLLKGAMERILDGIEGLAGPLKSARTEDFQSVLEIDYRDAWAALEVSGDAFQRNEKPDASNYQAHDELLTSSWDQNPPYNDDCPWMGCSNSNGRAIVGCVATAAAQIMRYWNWPPYGMESPYSDSYDWPNMPDRLTTSSPQAQIDAVAELCHEVGVAVGMDYGCDRSGADTYDMEDVYEDHFWYSTGCVKRDRDDYSALDWFNKLKSQFNVNRPVQYRVLDHSIVGDGWREIYVGGVFTRQYHMNYGYGWTGTCQDGCNTWYTLDALHLGGVDEEYMLENIYPAPALRESLSGTYYCWPSSYRYFDRDASSSGATFESGHYLQFLPRIVVKCTSTAGGMIRFVGSGSQNTLLFSRGDMTRGCRIYNGAIRIYQNGGIKLE